MRFDFRANTVFQRRNDLSARGIVFGIGREHQHDVERQTNWIPFNLHVAFLHDVEQADLNLACKIRQLIDGENSTIGTGKQTVMDAQLATQ